MRVDRRQVAVVLEHRAEAAAELVLARAQIVRAALGAVGTDQRHRQARALRRRDRRATGRRRRRHRLRRGLLVHAEAARAAEAERRRNIAAARRAAAHAAGRRGRRAGAAGSRSTAGTPGGGPIGGPIGGGAIGRAHRADPIGGIPGIAGGPDGGMPHRTGAHRGRLGRHPPRPRDRASGAPGELGAWPGSAIIVFIIPMSPPPRLRAAVSSAPHPRQNL